MVKKTVVGLAVATLALLGASPALAQIDAYSPSGKAWASTGYHDTAVWLKQNGDGKSHADYYRTDDDSPYHLWNKNGGVTNSSRGATIYRMRACDWVPDNDDNCGGWNTN